jgi:hypothetical protein
MTAQVWFVKVNPLCANQNADYVEEAVLDRSVK